MVENLGGLTSGEAAARLKSEGFNELPSGNRRSVIRIAVEVATEPMFALLLAAGIIYLLIGDHIEALILLVFAGVSVGIAIVQETRSEHVLDALRDLTSPRALVIRDGERIRIPGREVVRGDLVILSEGDRIPADGILRSSSDLLVDESLLTGESVPVRKIAAEDNPASAAPGGDDHPFVFSASLVVRGQGMAEVTATGPLSQIGKIGQTLGEIEQAPPRLTLQTRRLVRVAAIAGIGVSILVFLLYGILRGDWLQALLGAISLVMSMLPEEFPLVLTVFMVMGACRISRARVLTRKASAIETLGSATILCTDKTGTLTQNRMTVAELRVDGEALKLKETAPNALPDDFREVLKWGILASAAEPFDPMEKAFHDLWRERHPASAAPSNELSLVREYGLRPELLAVTQIWAPDDGGVHLVAAKGAPEAVAGLCRLAPQRLAEVLAMAQDMAAHGMRVLGVASARHDGGDFPASPAAFDFRFLGLVGLADPLRPEVPQAVAECRSAGVRTVMITGDYPATAQAVAREAGIDADNVLTGTEIESLSDEALAVRVRSVSIYARVMPSQKLRIVRAFRANGEVVAMTGDGVNDAPSLKAADIGIAMGGRGTDVAREASAIVLLDDDFGSIVKTIRLGRRIYDNLRKAMGYILAVHVPIAGLALLPLLFGTPMIFAPIHIAFLEMVIDPVCSIVFEAESEEDDVMRRPPRAPDSPLFSTGLVVWGLVQGILAFALTAAVYIAAMYRDMPDTEVRALAYVTLVLTNVGLIFVNRSFSSSLLGALTRPNRALWIVLGVALPLLLLSVRLDWVEHLFRFGPLHADDLSMSIGAALLLLVILELLKRFWHRRLTS
ncbi:MAG: cation-translocating P-type ATPase [Parvibaculum sp.]|uniref:cation-translocating P-type ATPase n=1 Tax=Parvibaculum sp. TaxID=2024848 RepID=UPI00284A8B45|nr:cation-translocating P-type ATPase [Parvibaculum sp.]MDR3500840.1 cation-translocating P-type ATPase [Parvibaculum sp.]